MPGTRESFFVNPEVSTRCMMLKLAQDYRPMPYIFMPTQAKVVNAADHCRPVSPQMHCINRALRCGDIIKVQCFPSEFANYADALEQESRCQATHDQITSPA